MPKKNVFPETSDCPKRKWLLEKEKIHEMEKLLKKCQVSQKRKIDRKIWVTWTGENVAKISYACVKEKRKEIYCEILLRKEKLIQKRQAQEGVINENTLHTIGFNARNIWVKTWCGRVMTAAQVCRLFASSKITHSCQKDPIIALCKYTQRERERDGRQGVRWEKVHKLARAHANKCRQKGRRGA